MVPFRGVRQSTMASDHGTRHGRTHIRAGGAPAQYPAECCHDILVLRSYIGSLLFHRADHRLIAMKINLTSVFVDDQQKALTFYTDVLGFVKKHDIPAGEFRWLTVVSPDGPNDIELLLEPNNNPAASTYQKSIYEQGIPSTAFSVEDIHKEYERMKDLGVAFHTEPTAMGPVTIAVFDDTCGNLIQIVQG